MPLEIGVPTTPRCWDRPRVCVEVTQISDGGLVRVRDTKQRSMHDQPALLFSADEWVKFIAEVKEGKFDYTFPDAVAVA